MKELTLNEVEMVAGGEGLLGNIGTTFGQNSAAIVSVLSGISSNTSSALTTATTSVDTLVTNTAYGLAPVDGALVGLL